MSEWLLLGELMQAAERRSRREVVRFAEALMRNARDTAVRAIAAAYLEGARTTFRLHAASLGLAASVATNLTPRTRRRLTERAVRQAGVSLTAVLTTLDGRADVTRAVVEARAATAVREAVWTGQDDAAKEAASIAEAEYKTWVRSWPRKQHRDHHDTLEGVTIPSEDLFTLPGGPNAGARVQGPRDWDAVPDPAEHMSCGHALRYATHVTGDDLNTTRRLGRTVYEPPSPARAGRRA